VIRSPIKRFLSLSVVLLMPAAAGAQTPRGEGNVSVMYQRLHTSGQLNTAGEFVAPDSTAAHSLVMDVEFGVTNRLAVHASLPYMAVRFVGGPHPHPVGIHGQPSNLDNGEYHATAQDFHLGGRWTLVQSRRLMLTPYADVVVPSHHYESLGQAVVGRDLRALVVGTAIGGFPDVLPGLYVQGQVSHAFVQKVLSVRANQSALDGEVGYFVTPRVAARFVEAFQFTHDGIEFVGLAPAIVLHQTQQTSRDIVLNHDRLLMTRVVNVGGGVSVGLSRSIDVFANATKSTWGRNIQRDRTFSAGVNVHFRTHGGTPLPHPERFPASPIG
jgi:hypothetical protein